MTVGKIGAAAFVLAVGVATIVPAGEPGPEIGRLRAHVARLASAEFAGRSGEGGRKAGEYVAEEFRRLGLTPLFDGSYFQDVPRPGRRETLGRNVGAKLVGSDPGLRDEWVILSAHYDHLGVRNGVLFPGADDNASSVAMMLEAARCLAHSPAPRRSVMLVSFDLEELGLIGSRHFVEHPPVPLEKIKLFVTADLIGGSLGGVCPGRLFAFGAERTPGLRPWIDDAARGEPRLRVGQLGSDILLIDRSDYGPFRVRKVPYLFFSTGQSPRYHRPTDTADTIDFPRLEAISRVILRVVRKAAEAGAVPGWASEVDPPRVAEAEAVREVLSLLLDNHDHLSIPPAQAATIRNVVRDLLTIEARGTISPGERARMVRAAQMVLYSVLR